MVEENFQKKEMNRNTKIGLSELWDRKNDLRELNMVNNYNFIES